MASPNIQSWTLSRWDLLSPNLTGRRAGSQLGPHCGVRTLLWRGSGSFKEKNWAVRCYSCRPPCTLRSAEGSFSFVNGENLFYLSLKLSSFTNKFWSLCNPFWFCLLLHWLGKKIRKDALCLISEPWLRLSVLCPRTTHRPSFGLLVHHAQSQPVRIAAPTPSLSAALLSSTLARFPAMCVS